MSKLFVFEEFCLNLASLKQNTKDLTLALDNFVSYIPLKLDLYL